MEDDWTYTKTGPKQQLQDSNYLGTRRKKKKSKTKNHLEANGWKGKGRSGMAIVARSLKTVAANWDKWRDSVKALCARGTKSIGEVW